MDNIFEKYSGAIIRYEHNNYSLISKLNLNNVNKKTTFKIVEGDGFLHTRGAKYFISGKYLHEDGTNYGHEANVKLVDNFVAHLFSHIEVEKHNKLLDEIEYTGQASTIKATVNYSDVGPRVSSGLQSNFERGGNFSALGN